MALDPRPKLSHARLAFDDAGEMVVDVLLAADQDPPDAFEGQRAVRLLQVLEVREPSRAQRVDVAPLGLPAAAVAKAVDANEAS
jgi:hypothetical protein